MLRRGEHEGRIPRGRAAARGAKLGFLGFRVLEAFGGPGVEGLPLQRRHQRGAARAGLARRAGHHDAERVANDVTSPSSETRSNGRDGCRGSSAVSESGDRDVRAGTGSDLQGIQTRAGPRARTNT